jgi:hypothetical protein
MADFKLTYATMFNPPDELHTGFDKAVETFKKNMGKEYGMYINGKEVFADEKLEDRSPVNTDWVLAKMQKGNALTPSRQWRRRARRSPCGAAPRGRSAWNCCAKPHH